MKQQSLSVGLVVLCVWAVLPSRAVAAPRYSVQDLGIFPGGTRSVPYAMNNLGQAVGTADAGGMFSGFFYDGNGPLQALGSLGGAASDFQSVAHDINDAAQITGYSYVPSGEAHAFRCTGTSPMQDLGTLGGRDSFGLAINNLGQVVGNAHTANGEMHAFLQTGNGPMQDLGTMGGTMSSAMCINDHGQIAGDFRTTSGVMHAFLYSGNGPTQDLGSLGGGTTLVYDINNKGQVIGDSQVAGSGESWHAFLYSGDGPMRDLGTLGGASSFAEGINNAGQIVGGSDTATDRQHAFLINGNGPMLDLNDLIVSDVQWMLMDAVEITDAGQILARGFTPDTNMQRALLLTPIPEPATLWLLVLGGLLARRRSLR